MNFSDMTMTLENVIKHWMKELSVMLKKLKGNINVNVNKLRGILVMKSDYNSIDNKILLRIRLARRAESRKCFADELEDNRKLYKAICITLGRKLIGDFIEKLIK